jgi:rhamnosyltransferase
MEVEPTENRRRKGSGVFFAGREVVGDGTRASPAKKTPDPVTRDQVCAIAVSFQPDLDALAELIDSTAPQVERLLVVDNGSNQEAQAWLRARRQHGQIGLLELGENLGVAAAHNRGIDWARQHGFRCVLLMDQDSVPAADMVARLLLGLHGLQQCGQRVAAVGPQYEDQRHARPAPFIQFGLLRNRHIAAAAGQPVRVDFLISSGKLIPLDVLEEIGGMDEGLFIDNVDMEWCFRATARGYRLFGIGEARLRHRLGDHVRHIWFLRTRRIIEHSPLRLYYIMRNRLSLYALPHTPWRWVCKDLPRLVMKLALFGLLVRPRRQNTRMMLRGLWDGLHGRRGRYVPAPHFARRRVHQEIEHHGNQGNED